MAKMGGQQQQEMNEFGQQFVGGRQQQQQHQFGELMNLPCSPSVSGTAALSVVEPNPPPACGAGGSSYLFQTASGSTICQLGTAPPPSSSSVGGLPPMDPCLCSPASSGSGSQTRLVHLSGASGGANDSGLSSLSGGFGGGGGGGQPPLHHHHSNFSPDVRGTEPLEELEPLARDRCNTWPLRRAMGLEGGNSQTSPLIHERIPEEESMYDDEESDAIDGGCVAGGGDDHHRHLLLQQQCHDAAMVTTNGCHQMSVGGGSNSSNGTLAGAGLCCETMMAESPCSGVDGLHDAFHSDEMSPLGRPDSAIGDSCSRTDSPPSGTKKSTTRRNAWGNMSYADLITRAISDSPEKRLTLSQVYEWMVQNVSYFRDKGDSNSSAGWKNSIRHNLSLHSRFMRIQNEGAGKSSWWVINPDAKPGRNPRRRANTMEAATKTAIDKKRRGARKRVETLVHQKGTGCSSASMVSIIGAQQSLFPGSDGGSAEQQQQQQQQQHIVLNAPPTGPNFETFRPRAQSTLSVVGGPSSSRLSPTLESSTTFESPTFDDFSFPSWMEEQQTSSMAGTTATTTNTVVVHQQQQNGGGVNKMQQNGSNGGPRCAAASSAMNPQVNELLDRTDQMRLEVVVVEQQQHNRTMNGVIKMEIGGDASQPQSSSAASSTTMLMTKNEICVVAEQQPLPNKQEPSPPGIPPPPSYQELSSVRRAAPPLQTNPLLRQLGIGGGGTPSPPQMKMGANISTSLSMAPCSSSAPPNIFSTSSIVQSSPAFLPTTIGNGCGPYQSMPPGGGVWMPAGPPMVGGQAVSGGQQQHQMVMMSSSMSPHHHQNNNINLINASGIGQFVVSSPGGVGALPLDLENVNAMSVDQALLSDLDVESMLRHDLAQGGQFDLP